MSEPDYETIYDQQAADYDRLVEREDFQDNIPRAISEIRNPSGLSIIELGAGTGRLTRQLAPNAKLILATDRSPHMLQPAAGHLGRAGHQNWKLIVAEHEHIPIRTGSADLIIAGWSLCYVYLDQERGRERLEHVLKDIKALLRPGGQIIVLETMGTGFTKPNPPPPMRPYQAALDDLGFHSTWIRTDYQFASPEEAVSLTKFFFGEELAAQVKKSGTRLLPECTGIWWSGRAD